MHFTVLRFATWASLLASGVSAAPISQEVLQVQHQGFDSIIWKLKSSEVIPDVLPYNFSPSYSLSLVFSDSHESVSLGNDIPVSATSSRPVFQMIPLSSTSTLSPTRTLAPNITYTLVLSDPDATSHADPTKSQMCHWIATGIRRADTNSSSSLPHAHESSAGLELRSLVGVDSEGVALEGADIEELVKYMGPAPPPKTGRHRYVFVLLEPEEGEEGKRLRAPKKREHFGYGKMGKGVLEWADDNSLRPIAANFFYASNEKK